MTDFYLREDVSIKFAEGSETDLILVYIKYEQELTLQES